MNVICVKENESLLEIKAEGDDIFDVAESHLCDFIKLELRPVQELLIIGHLDHNWYIECLLQILANDERDGVTEVKCLS